MMQTQLIVIIVIILLLLYYFNYFDTKNKFAGFNNEYGGYEYSNYEMQPKLINKLENQLFRNHFSDD